MVLIPLFILLDVEAWRFLYPLERVEQVGYCDRVWEDSLLLRLRLELGYLWVVTEFDAFQLEKQLPQGDHRCLLADQSDIRS